MANHQLLNHLGEVVVESISAEELDSLMTEDNGLNILAFDDSPETDIFEKLKTQKESDPEMNMENIRIHKEIL